MKYWEAQLDIKERLERVQEAVEDADYSNDNAKLVRELSEAVYMADRIEDLLYWLENETNYIMDEERKSSLSGLFCRTLLLIHHKR